MKILNIAFFIVFLCPFAFAQSPSGTPCRPPLEGDPDQCSFVESHHFCDAGSGNIPASPVSPNIKGNTPTDQFNQVINRKLACCLNEYTPGLSNLKFDCVENAAKKYSDFNELWASATDEDSGTMNALLLTNSMGKPITGFYTLDGKRCDELTEFLAPLTGIQAYKMDPKIKAGQQSSAANGLERVTGALYPIPTSSAYSDIGAAMTTAGRKYPDPNLDPEVALRCPILVRAAAVYACPMNPVLPLTQKTTTFDVGTNKKSRCTVASTIQIHIRMEQIFEITGSSKMKTIDTIADRSQVAVLSIEKLLLGKTGPNCPDGAHPWNNLCSY